MENFVQLVDELPPEARELVEKAESQIGKLQQKAQKETAAIQQCRPRDRGSHRKVPKKVEEQLEKLIAELKPLQVTHAKEGQLDEALAIREQIRQLKGHQGGAVPDPGNLVGLHTQIGQSFLFDVTGSTNGAIWGTDVYTSDSTLAVAAVHAGKVRPGERKAVRVTIVQPPAAFQGSTRNGVSSASYGPYPGAYRVG